jgi:hypothetical protein
MALYSKHVRKLRRIIAIAEKMIDELPKGPRGRPPLIRRAGATEAITRSKRIRRSGQELVQFRKMLKAERKKGVPVAELARRHGVTGAYIYMLR